MLSLFASILIAIAYTASMACLNITVKIVQAPVFDIMFMRYNIALLLTLPFIYTIFKRRCSLWIHALRGVGIFATNFFTYYGHKNASFITANVIGMSEPFFVLIFSALFYRRKIAVTNIFNLMIGYCGVMMIIYNGSLELSQKELLGSLSMVMANILAALFIFVSGYLAKNEKITVTLFFTTFMLWCLGWLIAPDISVYWNYSAHNLALLILIGLIAVVGHVLAITSLSKLRPEVFSPFQYLRLVFAIPLSYFVFNEIPSMFQLFGACLIMFGLYRLKKT